jgi:hypothetical protein
MAVENIISVALKMWNRWDQNDELGFWTDVFWESDGGFLEQYH